MELETYHYIIAVLGGYLAGVMNTLAGYGSIITLTILMDVLGLPGNIANATNRVNILSNTVAGSFGFYKNKKLDLSGSKWLITFVFLGAILGVAMAVTVSADQFKSIFKYLLLVIFIAVLINPKKWIHDHKEHRNLPIWKTALIYLPLGFYGGFIQMGMGIVFLSLAVLVSHYTMIKANALKLFVILSYTIMSIAIFQYNGLINWKLGAIIAIGQAVGGYTTAIYASKIKNANLYAYRILVFIVIIVILRTFGVF
ncbi:MAG: sulfite exporter TauE/SafE family protein [Saprospiraceae bacterium]